MNKSHQHHAAETKDPIPLEEMVAPAALALAAPLSPLCAGFHPLRTPGWEEETLGTVEGNIENR